MSELIQSEEELRSYLQAKEALGAEKVEIVVTESVLEASPEIARKYNYSIVDGEDLPNGYVKLYLVYRKLK